MIRSARETGKEKEKNSGLRTEPWGTLNIEEEEAAKGNWSEHCG